MTTDSKGDFITYASVIKNNNEVLKNKTKDDVIPITENPEYFRNFCTNITFDFGMRKWTDHKFIEDASFIKDWEETFDGFWENFENIYPKQPYQPTLISMGYKYSLRNPSNFNPLPHVVHFESITGSFYLKRSNVCEAGNHVTKYACSRNFGLLTFGPYSKAKIVYWNSLNSE